MLSLGRDVTQSKTTAEGWSFSKKNATYKTTSTKAGYSCDGSAITYSKKKDAATLMTVTVVKSAKGLSLSDNVVTVSKTALGTDKVTISKGYSFVLGGSVKQSSVKEDWSLNKTTTTLNQPTATG